MVKYCTCPSTILPILRDNTWKFFNHVGEGKQRNYMHSQGKKKTKVQQKNVIYSKHVYIQ